MAKPGNRNPIETRIRKTANLSEIEKVVLGLSGGADSIATAFALKQTGVEVLALHCNFHLRGEESNRDMEFVKDFCHSYNILLEVKEFDVTKFLETHKGISVEMACRDLRHEWFRTKMADTQADRIVTGHNADDNIETFFLNLLRGSGTRGLRGMSEDNGVIWRPLLKFHRKQILEYLEENKLKYVIDSTNLESDYRRNFLRNRIIPLMKEEWKGFDSALDKTLSNLSAENNIVEDYLLKTLEQETVKDSLSTMIILSSPAPLLLIKRFIDPLSPYISTPEEVLNAIKANKPHIRRWDLDKGILILRNKRLYLSAKK